MVSCTPTVVLNELVEEIGAQVELWWTLNDEASLKRIGEAERALGVDPKDVVVDLSHPVLHLFPNAQAHYFLFDRACWRDEGGWRARVDLGGQLNHFFPQIRHISPAKLLDRGACMG